MGALPQALEVIFEVQRKGSDGKITRRKISFSPYKICLFYLLFFGLFLLFGPLLLSNLITFLIFYLF